MVLKIMILLLTNIIAVILGLYLQQKEYLTYTQVCDFTSSSIHWIKNQFTKTPKHQDQPENIKNEQNTDI